MVVAVPVHVSSGLGTDPSHLTIYGNYLHSLIEVDIHDDIADFQFLLHDLHLVTFSTNEVPVHDTNIDAGIAGIVLVNVTGYGRFNLITKLQGHQILFMFEGAIHPCQELA